MLAINSPLSSCLACCLFLSQYGFAIAFILLSFLLSFISTHFSASGGQWQIQHCKLCPFLDVLPHCSNSLPSKNSTPTTVAVFSFVAFRFYGFTYITGPSRNVPDRTRQRRAAAIWIYDNDDAALISLRFRNRQSRKARHLNAEYTCPLTEPCFFIAAGISRIFGPHARRS